MNSPAADKARIIFNPYPHVTILIVLCCVLWVEGCAFITLKKELADLEQAHVLTGTVAHQTQPDKNVLILLYEKTKDGIHNSRAAILNSELGRYAIEAPPGVFYLLAFEDLNNNLSYDENEPIGFYGKPDPITISDGAPGTRSGLDITMGAPRAIPGGFSNSISITTDILTGSIVKVGQVVDFSDPILSPSFGGLGYWKPLSFIREVGFCLFFEQDYDERKTPVLFVHGAAGTPLGWENIVRNLDLHKFQPWFYYYPSGLPIEKVSDALNRMVMALHHRYQFKDLYVVAHSMGGLVSRSFILKNGYDSQQDVVKLFISISTPWNGHKMSARGVQQAPTAVPSWYDMVPDSAFITSLFQRRLPDSVKYHLLFSYRGDCSLFLENNDGTVELSSELDIRAQHEAQSVFGYNEDHGSILLSDEVLRQINRLMGRYQP